MAKFIKKYRGYLLIFGGAAFIVAVASYLTFFGGGTSISPPGEHKPPPLTFPKIEPFGPLKRQAYGLNWQLGPSLALPTKMTVYRKNPQRHSPGIASLWAKKFGFEDAFPEDTGVEYLWFKEKALFGYDYRRGAIRFEQEFSSKTDSAGVSREAYLARALALVREYSLFSESLRVEALSLDYYRTPPGGEGATKVTHLPEAEFIEVELTPYINDFPVVYDVEPYSLTQIQLSRQGELISLSHRFFSYAEALGDYPLKSLQGISSDLDTQVAVVGITCEGCEWDLGEIQEISLTRVEGVAYLFASDSKTTTLQPIFIISGGGNFLSGRPFLSRLYLPAIESP